MYQRKSVWIVLTFLALYVGSYLFLSRRPSVSGTGYLFPPEDSDTWRFFNFSCVKFYYPLILVDRQLGTGAGIAKEPLWNVSGAT